MRYYTFDLWKKLNSEIIEERKKARSELTKNGQEYFEIFQIVKNKLPKHFVAKYMKFKGFHDFKLEDIRIINQAKKSININFTISGEGKRFGIDYSGITNLAINYIYEISNQNGFDTWGYCEFFELSNCLLSHEILFASGATVLIHFKRIRITEVKD